MTVIVVTPGHEYQLSNASNPSGEYPQLVKFRRAAGKSYPGHLGTTNEELIEVVIHRLGVQNQEAPSKFNDTAIASLQDALKALQARMEAVKVPTTPAVAEVVKSAS